MRKNQSMKDYLDSNSNHTSKPHCSLCRWTSGKFWGWSSGPRVQKIKLKSKLLKCKNTIHITTFNIKTLERANQLPELTASAVEHNIDIICTQEHRYSHSELEIKYHNTGNGWMFVSVSAWKNSVNAIIGGVGMLFGPHAFKSLNSIEKIQPRMICASFNGNPCTTIISYYSLTNASTETVIIIFYKLSSLVRHIPKDNILIFGRDMNAKMGKDENNKFCSHNLSNRNEE